MGRHDQGVVPPADLAVTTHMCQGNDLTEEQQWAKLRLIAETAQEVWLSP